MKDRSGSDAFVDRSWSIRKVRIAKTLLFRCIVGSFLLLGSVAVAQREPEVDISARRHPNLAAAQQFSRQAWDKIAEAQRANEWDLGGHAAKAKQLLDQVNHELREAATYLNHKYPKVPLLVTPRGHQAPFFYELVKWLLSPPELFKSSTLKLSA